MSFTTAEELRILTLEQFVEAAKALFADRLDFDLRSYYKQKLAEAEEPEE